MLFARHLLSQWNANVVLCGRRSAEETASVVAELQSIGGAVVYLQADVADKAQMGEVVAKARQRFGVLHGVLHAAGVLADGYLERKATEDLMRVLTPKAL